MTKTKAKATTISNRTIILHLEFDNVVKECLDYHDDRALFISMFDQLMEAVREFESFTFKSPIICVAFDTQFDLRRVELKELQASLQKREMITTKRTRY